MKTLIVYYSLTGNTEETAKKLSDKLGADLLRLVPKKAYPSKGIKKFLWGGKSAVMGEVPPLENYSFDPVPYGRVIFGFPVWASTFAPPLRTFAQENAASLAGKRFAAFACQSGNGGEKAFEKLKKELNAETLDATLILIDPAVKPKPENEKKLEEFISALQKEETT